MVVAGEPAPAGICNYMALGGEVICLCLCFHPFLFPLSESQRGCWAAAWVPSARGLEASSLPGDLGSFRRRAMRTESFIAVFCGTTAITIKVMTKNIYYFFLRQLHSSLLQCASLRHQSCKIMRFVSLNTVNSSNHLFKFMDAFIDQTKEKIVQITIQITAAVLVGFKCH